MGARLAGLARSTGPANMNEDDNEKQPKKTTLHSPGSPLIIPTPPMLDQASSTLPLFLSRKYVLQGIIGMQQTIDEAKGDRFLIELRLGLRAHSNTSVRMSKYVFLGRGADDLCFPKGYEVKSATNVYFILPVKNQGGWLHHFLEEITRLYRKTKGENFFVNLFDFESDDVDVAEMIRASGVSQKINFISKTGPFHKTLAIQDAASRIPSPDDIVFLFDLHIDIPLNLLENVRKVSRFTSQRSLLYSSYRH